MNIYRWVINGMTMKEKEQKALGLMHKYVSLKREMKTLGISRTEGEPTGDYAEWLVSTKLGLQIVGNKVQSGYDLIDPKSGKTYQVKARRIFLSHQYKISLSKYDKYRFDYLIVVLFDENFEVRDAYQFPYKSITKFFTPEKENMKIMFSVKNYKNKFESQPTMKRIDLS